MRKVHLALIVLGFAFLAYLVWMVGPRQLWGQIHALGWGICLLVLVEGVANVAHTLGWRNCIPGQTGRVSLIQLFWIATAGYAINYLTPTASVGGDVSRVTLLSRTHEAAKAASSVLLDKLLTAIAHLLLVMVGAVFLCWRVRLSLELWVAMAVTTVVLAGGMGIFLVVQQRGKLGSLCRWLVARNVGGRSLEAVAKQLTKVDGVLRVSYGEHPGRLALAVGWHLLGHSAAILHAWLFLWLLGQPAPLFTVLAAGILSLWFDLLTFAVPMNLGSLEGSRVVLFKTLGCQALLGMAFGVTLRIVQLFWGCLGLAAYAAFGTRQTGLISDQLWSLVLTRRVHEGLCFLLVYLVI